VSVLEGRVLPATFVVNSFADAPDANPGDGLAQDALGRTTLRAAIMEANALHGSNQINLPTGTFTLSIAGAGEDLGATGDLDILNGNLTIVGVDANLTHIDAAQLDRVFDVHPGAGLSIYGVSLSGGRADEGGAVRVGTNATLILDTDILRNNAALTGPGGAVLIAGGLLDSTSTTFDTNTAAAQGGAIAVRGGTATILAAAVTGNTATNGGGLAVLDGSATITYSTFSGNNATGGGGALATIPGGVTTSITLQGSTVVANSATAGVGGLLSAGGFAVFDSIVAGNTGTRTPDLSGAFTDQGHNLIGDATGGSGFTASGLVGTAAAPIDPKLSSLGLHDGPTTNFVPYPGSPALDSGNTAGLASTDQRGLARTVGAAPDIGAVEARAFTLTNLSAGAHATLGSAFNPSLQVQLKEGPTGLAGVPVTFTAPLTGPGGTFAGSGTAVTNATGTATAPTFTANFTAGSYNVQASIGSALSVNLPVANDAVTGVTTFVTIDSPQTQSTAGNPVPVTVTVRNSAGQPLAGFTGTVTISSDDPLGDPPVVLSFAGTSTSTITAAYTLRQSGSHTIRATLDAAAGGGFTTSTVAVAPAAASTLILQAPTQIDAGSAFTVIVTAKDQFGNVATGYTGPVTLSSSDPLAILPAVNFAAGTGMATVSGVILRSSGSQSLQVTDAANGFTANAPVTVIPPGVTLDPVTGTEGSPITLNGRFPAGVATGATTVSITWGDDTPPTTLTLAPGVNSFSATHTYAANSTAGFPISAFVSDSAGNDFSGNGTAQIANVAPTVTLASNSVVLTQDQPFSSSGAFADPGNDTWTATVNYGDGTGDQPLALGADKTFNLQHTYSSEGTFNVAVTVRDNDGGVGTAQQQAAVFLAGTSSLVRQDVPPGTTATIVSDGVTVVYTNNSPNVTATVVIGRVNVAALAALDPPAGTADAYDVRVLNGDPRSILVASFHFTDNASQTGTPLVASFDATLHRFVLVRGSLRTNGLFVVDHTNDTVTILIDQTSAPTVSSLGGTLFTLSVPSDNPQSSSSQVFLTPASGQTLVSADAGTSVRQGTTTNLVSSSDVTLTLAASEGLRRGGFEDEPRRLPLDVKTVQRVFETVTDISTLLIETIRMFMDFPAPMVAPANPGADNAGQQAADAIRVDDLAPAAPAHAVIAEPPIVIDVPADVFTAPRQSFDEAIWFARRAEPAEDYAHEPIRARIADEPSEEQRFAALLTGLWVGGHALYASAPEVWIGARPAQRPRWKPRKMEDVSNN
jgi:CSLREA domain-containing protein